MARYNTEFLLSATSPAQFPPAAAPEFAFLGRSNVGKSSLINALTGQVAARVSSTPGRTRAINFFAIRPRPGVPPEMILADLPGYGYAKLARSIRAEWPSFIDPYLAARPTLAGCVCLVDISIPPQPSDVQLAEYLDSIGRARVIVATKADRVSGNERTKALRALRTALGTESILACSAKDHRGINELWSALRTAAAEYQASTTASTAALTSEEVLE